MRVFWTYDNRETLYATIFCLGKHEKSSVNTNMKSTARFPVSLRWSLYLAPKSPKGGLKNANGRFPSKIALRLNKVCYKVSLCENCQWQSCKGFIGLTNLQKWFVGLPLLPEILAQSDHVGAKSPILDLYSLSDSAVTPREKISVNGNSKSTTHFPMSPRWTSCDNSEKVRDRMSVTINH